MLDSTPDATPDSAKSVVRPDLVEIMDHFPDTRIVLGAPYIEHIIRRDGMMPIVVNFRTNGQVMLRDTSLYGENDLVRQDVALDVGLLRDLAEKSGMAQQLYADWLSTDIAFKWAKKHPEIAERRAA